MCIIDELYFQLTVTTYEVYEQAKKREWFQNLARWPWPSWDRMQGAIDVTANEQARTWEHLGRADDDIRTLHFMSQRVMQQPGIQTLQHFIDTRSIFVHSRCTFWNVEMRRWTYPTPTISKLGDDDPRKNEPKDAWNHLTKAVIYFMVNKWGYYGRSNAPANTKKYNIRKERESRSAAQLGSTVYNIRRTHGT